MATETVRESAQQARLVAEPESTQVFLKQIERSGALPEGASAEQAASAVLCTLARRLSGGETRALLSALPAELQSLLQPCAVHTRDAGATFGRKVFLDKVSAHFPEPPEDADELTRVVFRAVHNRVSRQQIADVAAQLPGELKLMWQDP